MPLISVIVPVYNVEKFLRRCIDSILAQTFDDFELILIDDGSPDSSGKICDEYKLIDKRVTVIHQKNSGLSGARNSGIDWAFKNSDSKWLTFIDSDDWVHPKYLEVLYKAVTDFNVSAAFCSFLKTDEYDNNFDMNIEKPYLRSVDEAYINDGVPMVIACAKLYKKTLFDDIRYPVGKLHEDEYTTYKLLFPCENIAFVPSKLYFYFSGNSGSIMTVKWNPKRLDAVGAYEEQLQYFKQYQSKKVLYTACYRYILCLIDNYNGIKTSDGNYSKYKRFIRKKLKDLLKKYGKELNLNHIKDAWIYEVAYPFSMKIYWIFRSFTDKITKKSSEK